MDYTILQMPLYDNVLGNPWQSQEFNHNIIHIHNIVCETDGIQTKCEEYPEISFGI